MAKPDSVAARLAQLQAATTQAESDAISGAYDDGALSVPTGTGFTQTDINNAVAAQQTADAATLSTAQAQASAALAVVQGQLNDMTAKDQADEAVIDGLQGSVNAMQTALDAIKALIPAPVPAPAS